MLAPGDPARALRLASALLDKPLMLNHARGLWGYSGTTEDGVPLTIQSTGLGGPSAAAVVDDLALLGARRIIRVGSCRSDSLPDGAIVGVGVAGVPEVTPGVEVTDLTTVGFLAAAAAAGVPAAAVLVVGRDPAEDREVAAGRAALAALSKA